MTLTRPRPRALTAEDGQSVATRQRVVIEHVVPNLDGGRFSAKRIEGDVLTLQADIFADGHDVIAAFAHATHEHGHHVEPAAFEPLGNDRWQAQLPLTRVGRYSIAIEAWVDPLRTWRRNLAKRIEAGQDIRVELQIGADLVRESAQRAGASERVVLEGLAQRIATDWPAADADLEALLDRIRPSIMTRLDPATSVFVDPARARASAWYEVFPRSTHPTPGQHGTLRTLTDRLPYIHDLGFDVVYLPPIHPIGRTHRKGKNNTPTAELHDVGSPWGIGSADGGHKSVHPDLGTLADFDAFVAAARKLGIDIALDLAFQCSPDHPYVKEHPEWFRHRPDGTIQYAENPPKKYQDIYPFDFEGDNAEELWKELKSVVDFWIGHGVRIFRVDNPHTKPFPFWEWLIGETKREHPDVLFLSEAFTRPKVRYRLAKLGFTHSYTYFAWRNTSAELRQYVTELRDAPVRDFFRPHFWVNTPDILTEYLQTGGRAAAITRFVLASTLVPNYGVYGPAFELVYVDPLEPGKEEYKDTEKFQIRHWDLKSPQSIAPIVRHVNRVRRENAALTQHGHLVFHPTDNDQLLVYSRRTDDGSNQVLVAVNLDPHHRQSGWTQLDLAALGLEPGQQYQVQDLLSDARYLWNGARNFIELRPDTIPAHIFRIRKRVHSEHDFDYYG